MQRIKKYFFWLILASVLPISSCEKFFEPEMGNVINKDNYFNDFLQYRAAEMGLYAIQQTLVEQIVVLGELRADLMEVTINADPDLVEISNFNVSSTNKYASPVNFYKLIGACNSLQTQIEKSFPSVLDKASEITTYDRLYGEVLCMKAWAYWNAVRIYKEVPYLWPSLNEISEIENYVNTPTSFVDSVHVIYDADGFHNDTVFNDTIVLDKKYLDMDAVIDSCTYELENKIKAVGVIHNAQFNDQTWDVTIWNKYALNALLGQMYFFRQDYTRALANFNPIMYNTDSEVASIVKFGLDSRFSNANWDNILTQIDPNEHIFSLYFSKANQQNNEFQTLFSIQFPNAYMLKPTGKAIQLWENMWNGMQITINNANPSLTTLRWDDNQKKYIRGNPGDFYRGYGVSYGYFKNGSLMDASLVSAMLNYKAEGNQRLVDQIMEDVDTVIYKYSFGKTPYDRDANFMIYRAAGIHLYFAEIYARWVYLSNGVETQDNNKVLSVVNNGSYNNSSVQRGVRGRVGFADGAEALYIGNIVYNHNPETNDVIGYKSLTTLLQKQEYLEDVILDEKAREMAYEGERFYDLMRVAKRRNDPAYLADRVASKFTGAKREEIRQKLLDENNWYIPLFNK